MDTEKEKILNSLILLASLATLPVVILQQRGETTVLIDFLDWTIWSIFLFELVIRWKERRFGARLLSSLIVLLSFPLLPALLSLVRLIRVIRLLRLARFLRVFLIGVVAVKSIFGRPGVPQLAVTTVTLILLASGAIVALEPERVASFSDALWWAVVTASTVG